MKRVRIGVVLVVAVLATQALLDAQGPAKKSAREALQPFNELIGPWRGTGVPGAKKDAATDFWQETLAWEWQFKQEDAWLTVKFEKSKYYTDGELRWLPERGVFELTLRTINKQTRKFTGTLNERILTLENQEPKDKELHRLVITMLHETRFLYREEFKAPGKALFTRIYQVGATREGVQFASGDGRPECVVSGGLGTTPVNYMGKTYYVCCTGCRDEFNANPAKYISEYEAKKKKKGK